MVLFPFLDFSPSQPPRRIDVSKKVYIIQIYNGIDAALKRFSKERGKFVQH